MSTPPDSAYFPMSGAAASSAPKPSSQDPFYVVKDKVQAQVKSLRQDFERWKTLLETCDTSRDESFAELHQSLRVDMKKVKFDLNDLSRTIQIVEGNRKKFPAISDEELASRQRFVNDTKATLQAIKEARGSDRTKRKMASDKEKKASTPFQRDSEQRASQYVAGRQEQHQQLVERQDVVLDDMSAALARLGDVANTMNTELDAQNAMLEDFDDELDETKTQMDIAMARIQKILGTSSKWKICTMLILFVLAVALLMAVIYT